ncbi:MAG TPA: hypothetical protein VF147_12280 [Vicinamibacterales bacterium]
MEERVARLESLVAYLTDRVAALEERLAQQEPGTPAAIPAVQPSASFAELVGLPGTPAHQWLGLVGRTLVILGGAYLLRALTGSHVIPVSAGIAAGLLYGAPWLVLASHTAARGQHVDAFTHATTTALIGYPLVWEATLRFHALTPVQSAFLLGALSAAAFALAWMRQLPGLAWVVTVGALLSALGLAIGTGHWSAYTVLAIGVGIATLWLGYVRDWMFLRWPSAGVANVMLLVVTGRAMVSGNTRAALALQGLMLFAYLGSFAVRTLVIGREVIPFEVVQSIGVLAVAFGGAIALIRSTGSNVLPVGLATIGLAAAGYLVAFMFVERHRHAKNFFFYALLALLFAIVGITISAPAPAAAIAFAAIGCVAVALAHRYHRFTISLHAVSYVLAGAVLSGLLSSATLAIAVPATSAPALPTLAALVALAALAFAAQPMVASGDGWARSAAALRVIVLALLAWTASGVAIAALAGLVAGGGEMDASVLATVRTAVLVLAALGLSALARTSHGREAGWLVYPMIALIGVKLLFADFPQGRPETLFVALAAYGCALILAPRLMRRTEPSAAQPAVE